MTACTRLPRCVLPAAPAAAWRAAGRRVAVILCAALCASCAPGPAAAQGQPDTAGRSRVSAQVFADKAQEHFYSMELADAVVMFKEALAREPQNPDYWISLGHVYLFQMLEKSGRLGHELFPASAEFLPPSTEPDPALHRLMWDALLRGRGICEKRIASHPPDSEAYYFLGLSHAIESSYHFNLLRKYLDAYGPANRAREAHEKVRALDTANHDANLILGAHQYAIGSVPGAFRWVLRLAGYSGTRENGVKLVQDALLHGKRGPAGPLLMLAYIYNREKEYAYSRQMLAHLVRFYPRNPHYELHLADSFRKEGKLEGAVEAYQRVENKMRDGAPGYARVDAPRLAFQLGAALARLGKHDLALAYYRQITAAPEGNVAAPASSMGASTNGGPGNAAPAARASAPAPPILVAHAWLRIGDLHRALAQKDAARAAYSRAAQLPFPDVKRAATARLRELGRSN